jgi:poly(beta-D-mannuronate) lyase
MPVTRNSLALCALLISFAHAQAQAKLQSPWDTQKVRVTDAPYTCPTLAPIPRDLVTDGFYRLDDPTHSIIDPVRMAAYTASAGPVKNSGTVIVAAADAFRQTGSKAAGQCVVRLSESLAKQQSFSGRMSSNQAFYVQGWIGGAIAIAYLKVRGYDLGTAADEAAIGAWLKVIAKSTRDYYDARATTGDGQNNHLYWAGVEIAAIGIVANDRHDFDWGIKTYDNGVNRIQPDGTLPLEMERGARALHYHLYALAPLVELAEFGEANGLDLYAHNHGAIQRLVKLSVAGLVDPTPFQKATGMKQDISAHPSGDQIGWAPPYLRRFPDPTLAKFVAKANSLYVFYLGGLPPA